MSHFQPPTAARSRAIFRSRRARISAALLAGMLVFAGCAATEPKPSGAPTTSVNRVPVSLPQTVVGVQGQWVLDTLNRPQEVSPEEVASHFAQVMLDQAPAVDLAAILNGLRAQREWVPTIVQETSEVQMIVTMYGSSGPGVDMSIAVDGQGLIHGLFFGQATETRTPATSWKELSQNIDALPFDASLTVTRVGDDPGGVFDAHGDKVLPIGSIFKLYVLGAVVEAVASGELSWDDTLTVTEGAKSLPPGELQDAAEGTQVSVRDAAAKMISLSDNTATDLLFNRVGRDAVTAAMKAMGHHDPALNTPFLNSREVSQLGWSGDKSLRERWEKGNRAERLDLLAALPGGPLNVPVENVTDAVWQYGLDWFADPSDLVSAHTYLQEVAQTDAGAPVRDILSLNPGAGLTLGDGWVYTAFKGGSAPGELAGSWYLEDEKGDAYVVTIQGASENPQDLAATSLFFGNVEDAFALLAAESRG
ncbi:serine hydrolase [Lysinibacter sp. HNR]|uniref:serine hydrolase n=1 Tax=Lysinibacter sp. HNR TaxID=3031408 RepID=UPI00243520FE|nr:serine hydrolase [Lysinibacter sp. HNR]WGD37148.1 serine hydrolase [Lysinibacter sp. HNR]